MNKNYNEWVNTYEGFYGKKMEYNNKKIKGN